MHCMLSHLSGVVVLFYLITPSVAPGAGEAPAGGGGGGAAIGAIGGSAGGARPEAIGGGGGRPSEESSPVGSSTGNGAHEETVGGTNPTTVQGEKQTEAIKELIDTINEAAGAVIDTFLDDPQNHDDGSYFKAPNTELSSLSSAMPPSGQFFQPLNATRFACLATEDDVMCLPNGKFDFNQLVIAAGIGVNFSIASAKYLLMPQGSSVTVSGTAKEGDAPNDIPYTANITSDQASADFNQDINDRINSADSNEGPSGKVYLTVSVPFDEPAVCSYAMTGFQLFNYCWGVGSATVQYLSTQSFIFSGGATLNATWSNGQTFSLSTNTGDIKAAFGLPDGGEMRQMSITAPAA